MVATIHWSSLTNSNSIITSPRFSLLGAFGMRTLDPEATEKQLEQQQKQQEQRQQQPQPKPGMALKEPEQQQSFVAAFVAAVDEALQLEVPLAAKWSRVPLGLEGSSPPHSLP